MGAEIPGHAEDVMGSVPRVTVLVPGKCVTGIPNTHGCYNKDGNPIAVNSTNWTGTYTTSTVTTEPKTVTYTFNGSQGMTAIVEPTIERGRLNPKGKITGYNWNAHISIAPSTRLLRMIGWSSARIRRMVITCHLSAFVTQLRRLRRGSSLSIWVECLLSPVLPGRIRIAKPVGNSTPSFKKREFSKVKGFDYKSAVSPRTSFSAACARRLRTLRGRRSCETARRTADDADPAASLSSGRP